KSPIHAARTAVKRFNCLNCHQRDGEGGIDAFLVDKMKALENAENADDVQPPKLTGIGHKMRTSWMKDVLLNAGRARPWMTLRMPQYGNANVGTLHEHLPLLEGAVTDDTVAPPKYTKEKVDTGRALAGKQGHGCISCHDISGQRGGGTRGPDLATTNQRVRYDWYVRWMHQPQRMVPGTKMPQAFIEGKSLLDQYYKGDGDQQIEALWAYFSLGPGLPLPAGMEPTGGMTVVVRDKPEILRTFMPD
ncbi:MAG: c-type cytochrome, partial [Armatimonadaceae bacterium]